MLWLKIFVLLGGGFLVYKVFFKGGLLKNDKQTEEIKKEKESNIIVIKNKIDSDSLTIGDAQAEQISGLLLTAMDKIGTDEKAIFNALEGLSKEDFALVYTKFGTVSYADGGTPSRIMNLLGAATPLTLTEWFNRELSKKDYNKLKSLYEGIIKF
ncbi:MAG TPA: hypothetical protein DCG75_03585 [Bacteroidales bacterium]|nr:hypothetical protein [Bacteroidales bacterium]